MINRKAESMTLGTIVVAALVLIVLVVLVVIFSGKIGGFGKGVSACSGSCEASASVCTDKGLNPIYIINCDANGDGKADKANSNYCCMNP